MWGPKDLSTEGQLFIDGHVLSLRANIHSALLAIREHRRHDRIKTRYPFWIDLICIQQDCTEEKNHQVQQMGDIYAEAKCVIIWLGEQTRLQLARHQIRQISLPKPTTIPVCDYTALFWALLNQHWTRTWILQEICLAKQVAIVTRTHIFRGSQLQQLMTQKVYVHAYYRDAWIVLDETAEHPHTTAVAVIERFEKVWMVRQSRRDVRWKPISLCSTIHQLALYSDCFEHRDKVFALLPMASTNINIKVDYNIDEVALFWEALKSSSVRDIDEYEISALREVLKLSWHRILQWTINAIRTDTILHELSLPCRLDCGFLSLKRARQAQPRDVNKHTSFLINCYFRKDYDTTPFMLQMRLFQQTAGIYIIVDDAAYCPDINTKTVYHGLRLSSCRIRTLDASWDKRRELVTVDPVLYITLCLLADLKHDERGAELRKIFPWVVEGEDRYFRQRRSARRVGKPLREYTVSSNSSKSSVTPAAQTKPRHKSQCMLMNIGDRG